MGDRLQWAQCENQTAFAAFANGKTYYVRFLFDAHAWLYEGRPFEHVDMAKVAAQAEHEASLREGQS